MAYERIDLEAKVAFLERTIDGLNDALRQQSRVLDDVQERVSRLEKRLRARDTQPEVGPQDTPPPHY